MKTTPRSPGPCASVCRAAVLLLPSILQGALAWADGTDMPVPPQTELPNAVVSEPVGPVVPGEWSGRLEAAAWNRRLDVLEERLLRETRRARAWDKALARTDTRAAVHQRDGRGDPRRLADLRSAIGEKRGQVQGFVLDLEEQTRQLPRWRELVRADGVNRELERQVADTEILLARSGGLGGADWALRSPEELWAELERVGGQPQAVPDPGPREDSGSTP